MNDAIHIMIINRVATLTRWHFLLQPLSVYLKINMSRNLSLYYDDEGTQGKNNVGFEQ